MPRRRYRQIDRQSLTAVWHDSSGWGDRAVEHREIAYIPLVTNVQTLRRRRHQATGDRLDAGRLLGRCARHGGHVRHLSGNRRAGPVARFIAHPASCCWPGETCRCGSPCSRPPPPGSMAATCWALSKKRSPGLAAGLQGGVCFGISLILGGLFFAGPMRRWEFTTLIDPFEVALRTRLGRRAISCRRCWARSFGAPNCWSRSGPRAASC